MAGQESIIFDQKAQKIKNQTNTAGDINVTGNYIAGDYIDKTQGPDLINLIRSYSDSI